MKKNLSDPDLEQELSDILREEINKEFKTYLIDVLTGKAPAIKREPIPKENWCFGIYHYMKNGEHWFRIRGQGDVYDECCRDLNKYKMADQWDDWPWFGIKFALPADQVEWVTKWQKDIIEDYE